MSERTDRNFVSETGTGRPLETLRGKQLSLAKLRQPPAQVMARYCFRPWEADDAPVYQRMLDDAELWRYMPEAYPGEISPDMAGTLIELSRQASHHKVRAVEYQGRVIGQMRMQWKTDVTPPQSGEISYWLGRDYWGLGLAAPMIALFSWRCFSIFPALSMINARVHRENMASQRVLERLGWTRVGIEGDWQEFRMQRQHVTDWASLNKPVTLPG